MARTLLIVDDIKSNREILKNILGDEYTIQEASDGQAAIDVMNREFDKLSAVLLDLRMPVMDGFEVLRYMRDNGALSQLPVIVMTGQTDSDTEEQALKLGAKDYISKPYKSAIIKQRIWNTINLRETAATVNALRRDRLTGLFSREAFFAQVATMVAQHEPGYYVMACFDVEKFKVVNDQYGTQKGDEVLCHIARVFSGGFESHGGVCCRISADNFATLYPASFQDTEELAQIRQKAGRVPGLVSPLVFSIGRYLVDDPSLSPSAMYDRAMMAADSIKGRYDRQIACYDESLRNQLLRVQDIVTEMDAALKARQFEVWFQPQYNHSTGALIGAEALARWRHPQKGLISPGVFVPIFEKTGFIYAMDKYIWEEVCRFLREELLAGRSPLPVSVNISRYDAFCPDILEVITGLVARYAIPAPLLRLEITESAFAESTKEIITVAKRLIDDGFTLEIDDFGSGYSSLNTLKSVPAQVVKLDMRFFEDDDASQRSGNIIESMVRMTKWLGMSVIAEGVERIDQADFLRSIGCNYIQGYLYAKPMPMAQYAELCRGTRREEKLIALETVENLDSNAFWDPKSMDTLIFNSFVGGACIYEYHQGNIELLRATEKYAQVIGSAGMTVEDALKLNWTEHLDAENRQRLIADLDESISTRKEVTDEYVFFDLPGCPHETHLRSTLRVIASVGDRYLVYCTNENITAQRMSEKREREVAERMRLIMANVSSGICASVYSTDGVSILFANDTYYSMFGYTKTQFELELNDPLDAIYPDDRAQVREIVERVIRERGSATYEYRCITRDDTIVTVHCNNTIASFADVEGDVLLGVLTDTTELALTRQKEHRMSEQMQAIMDNVDLGIIAAVVSGNTARYLFTNDHYYEILGYTKAQFEAEIHSPYLTVAQEDRRRVMDETARINHAEESTVITYNAVTRDGRVRHLRAAISMARLSGIDEPVQLSIIRDITEEMKAEQKIRNTSAQLQAMMDDIPGGFVRMSVDPNGAAHPIYFNDGFLRLVGMSREERMALCADDALAGVHPDDVATVKRSIAEMLSTGESHSARYRLRHGNGGYIWTTIFGRVTKDAFGEAFLNLYYTDATEQMQEEERQKELLDNLPGGAALYEYRDGELTVIHLNRRYWALVGRKPMDAASLSPMSAVHPDDRALVSREIASAIEQKRDMACDIRLRHETDGYRPFHLVGRIVPSENGAYSIYAVFTSISDEAMSIQEMLPIALSAVMAKQADYAFIKDRNLRYVCCSQAVADLAGRADASELIGRTDADLFDRALAEGFRSGDLRALAGETLLNNEDLLPPENGVDRFARTSKFPLKDSRGNIIGVYGVGRDITEARAMKSQLELLTDTIPGGLATYACTPGAFSAEHIRLTYFNDGFCRLFGLAREAYERQAAVNPYSMVFEEDLPLLAEQWLALMEDDSPINCLYRARVVDGGYKWISHKAVAVDRRSDRVIINAILQDVTDQHELIEQLRISEEENNLAVHLRGNIVCRYIVADRSLSLSPEAAAAAGLPETIRDVPYEPVCLGMIAPESAEAYTGFFEAILHGSRAGTVTFRQQYAGDWRWMEAKSSTIFSDDGKPVKAVLSIVDVTERLEKETIYRKWQQSLEDKAPASYTLFRCNLNDNSTYDTREGSLIAFDFEHAGRDLNERAREYARQCVAEDDRDRYVAFMNSDVLLAGYYRGKRSGSLEYRELLPGGDYRWLRLTVDLVEYPHSTEVEAYLMYEDVDMSKRAELQTKERAETDPLTGVLNRSAFVARVEKIIRESKPETRNAMLMLDVDGFKQVNDVFGHSVGDQALVDVAGSIRSMLRRDDLLGRLGGDEFILFLGDVTDDAAVINKAMQLCAVTRKAFSLEVRITASIGVAVTPRDGMDFETLYKKADSALYYVKGSGKNSCAFYREDMADEHLAVESAGDNEVPCARKRRMLIVDDSKIDHAMLTNIFADQFIIEKAKDGSSALIRLRHYGSAISVVLLDLLMPGMDGFTVLRKMRESAELRSVPVIVVSGDDNRDTGLRAIREGASDFVSKPVDPDLLRIRVQSAISKAENERLRAKNSLLEYRESEVSKYKSVLDRSGIVVVEHEWVSGGFTYDPEMSAHLAGTYDDRGLWRILLADFVADTATVKRMQETVHQVAATRQDASQSLVVRLKTPSKETHWFRVGIQRTNDEFGLTGKIYLSFIDLGAKLPAQP